MSGFYDKITNRMRFAFQFDKIYPTKGEMLLGCNTDGVYIGRYVLISQEASPGSDNYIEETAGDASRPSWQGSVWQKTRLGDGSEKYVFVADLNSISPKIAVTAVAPLKQEEIEGYDEYENIVKFNEKTSTDSLWQLHIPAVWTLRLEDEPDFNLKGFDKSKSNVITPPVDEIGHSYYSSGLLYYDGVDSETGKAKFAAKDDIYQIDITMQSIGNTMSKVWDTLYGQDIKTTQRGRYFFYDYDAEDESYLFTHSNNAARNQDIRWDSYDGIRGVPKNLLNQSGRYYYKNYKANVESVAGAINSAHDLMGMIIRDYETLSNVANWDPSKIYYIGYKFYRKAEKREIVEDPNPSNNYEEVTLLNLDAANLYREDWGEYARFLDISDNDDNSDYPAGKKYINYRKPSIIEHLSGSLYDTVSFSEKTLNSNWADIYPAWAMLEENNYYEYDTNASAPTNKTAPYFKIVPGAEITGQEVYIPDLYWVIEWDVTQQKRKRALLCTVPFNSLTSTIRQQWPDVDFESDNVRFYNVDVARVETVTEGTTTITGPTIIYDNRKAGKKLENLLNLENNYYVKHPNGNNYNYERINRNYKNNVWTYMDASGAKLAWWEANKNGTLVTATITETGVVYGLDSNLNKWFYKSGNDYVKETMWRMPIVNNATVYEATPTKISYTAVLGDDREYYTTNTLTTKVTSSNFGPAATRTAFRKKEYYIRTSTNPDHKVGNRYYGDPNNLPYGVTLGVLKSNNYVAEEIPGYSYDQGTMNGLILATSNALDRLKDYNNDLESVLKQVNTDVSQINNFAGITANNVSFPDSVTLVAGDNITLTPSSANKTITIKTLDNIMTLDGGTAILENDDLNDYLTIGNYYCLGNSRAENLVNCPTDKAFLMKIGHPTGISDRYLYQYIRTYDKARCFYRYYNNDPGSSIAQGWQPWIELTYSSKDAVSGGTDLSLVTTGDKYTWNNKSNLTLGTTSTTAAAGNHTHTTSLVANTGDQDITLTSAGTYKLTAGGSSIIFKMPSLPLAASGTRGGIQIGYSESGQNYAVKLSSEKAYVSVPWTDTKVTQTNPTNSNGDYTLLLSSTGSGTGPGVTWKAPDLTYHPAEKLLKINKMAINGSNNNISFNNNTTILNYVPQAGASLPGILSKNYLSVEGGAFNATGGLYWNSHAVVFCSDHYGQKHAITIEWDHDNERIEFWIDGRRRAYITPHAE